MTPESRNPQVSVLVTVFNREAYLQQTLSSIAASGFCNWEAIVVDDCSKDNSIDVANDFARSDSRFRIVRNEENLGDYGNRMKAASLAKGAFLKYVDSDDLIYPQTLGVMVDAMTRYRDAVVGVAHSLPEDDRPYPWRLTPEETYRKHFLGRGCLSCGPTGAIIRRSAFEAVGGFRKEWGVLSDTDLWYRLAAKHPIVLLPPGLVWWRRHEDQEFTKDDANEVYLHRGFELDMEALQTSCPLPEALRRQAIDRKKQHHARRILSVAIRQRKLTQGMRLFRESEMSIMDLARGLARYR